MKNRTKVVLALISTCVSALAVPIPRVAQSCFPLAFEQIISIDYHSLKESKNGLAFKQQVLPANVRTFETALESAGVNPDKDLDTFAFTSFRNAKHELKQVGVATGNSLQTTLKKNLASNQKPVRYLDSDIYPMPRSEGPAPPAQLFMVFLDEKTVLLGEGDAVGAALLVRNGQTPNLVSKPKYATLLEKIENSPVWSVLDRRGSEELLLPAIDSGAPLSIYAQVRNSILDSFYTIKFGADNGLNLDFTVLTKDGDAPLWLLNSLKGGTLIKSVVKNPTAKMAFKSMQVSTDDSALEIQFRTDPQQLDALLQARFFTAVLAPPKESPAAQTR